MFSVTSHSHKRYFEARPSGISGTLARLCLLTRTPLCVLLSPYNSSRIQRTFHLKKRTHCNTSQCRFMKLRPRETESCWRVARTALLQTPTCPSPVTPSPWPDRDFEDKRGTCARKVRSSCGHHSGAFAFLCKQTARKMLSGRHYLNLTATRAPVLFMDMPNLTFTMVIQGDSLRWRRGPVAEGDSLLLCLRSGSEQKS